MTVYRCELAWLPDGSTAADIVIEVADGRIIAVEPSGSGGRPVDETLRGLVLPGAANAHSHVFHRALRGRTQGDGGSFWDWRARMYEAASRLDPDRYLALARATYAEMASAGFTAVGEFHYLHHGPDGVPYDDPNELGLTLVEAARQAGLRITLLDTCYLSGGVGEDLGPVQRRFGDGDAARWASRVEDLHERLAAAGDVTVGAAIHSVRAVPAADIPVVVAWATSHGAPLHVHVSEQPAENEACHAVHGRSPTVLLADCGALGPRTTAVHATHLDDLDVRALAGSGARVCLCPTTERDLGDGIGPADRLAAAGVSLSLGTDSHAVIDAFEEARAIELDLRLATLQRGNLPITDLFDIMTAAGQTSLGTADAGRLQVGARADLVAVDLTSVRTAGASASNAAAAVVFGAAAADVTDVIVDGNRVVRDRAHVLGDVGALLAGAIEELWS